MAISALLALAAATSATPSSVLTQLPAALAQAVRAFDDAQIGGDAAALNRLLADDYALINSHAGVETKQQMIADYTAPGFHLEPYVVERPIVRRWQGGAVIGGEVHLRGSSAGEPFDGRLRFADVWRLHEGRWQVVFTEVTPMR